MELQSLQMEKIKFTSIILLLLIFSCSLAGQNTSIYTNKINEAHACILEKKYEEALHHYMEAFACKASRNPIHWYEASSGYLEKRNRFEYHA